MLVIKIKKARLTNVALTLIAATTLIFTYEYYIAISNSYMGYLPHIYSLKNLVLLTPMLLAVILATPAKIQRPSDFFLLFYSLIVLVSATLFSQVVGVLTGPSLLLLYVLLLAPILFFYWIRRISFPARILGIFKRGTVYNLLLVALGFALVYGVSADTGSGFGWDSMYERRLAGRESIGTRNVTAYLVSMASNGIGPFMTFVGVLRKRILFVALGLMFAVFSFWLLGLKAPFVMSLIFMSIGYLIRRGAISVFPTFLMAAVTFIGLASLTEVLLSGSSLIAEFILRRAFVVQGVLQSYYADLIASAACEDIYSVMLGIDSSTYGKVTYLVGANYLNNPAANANTNAFLYAMSSGGVFAFAFVIVFVGIFFAFLDSYYRATRQDEIYFVAAVYALLLTEQSFSTAFVSSGVGVILIAILLIRTLKTTERDSVSNRLAGFGWRSSGVK